MERNWFVLIAIFLIAAGIYIFLTHTPAVDDRSGFDVTASGWPPRPAEIRQKSGANGTDPDTPNGKQIRDRYADLFKKRYRDHTPMMAIGLKFRKNNTIDLMTPARMEPWNMDRLAIAAWHETQDAFGHPFDIDLFITYIGAPPLKIGWLRQSKTAPDKVEIVHLSKPIYRTYENRVAAGN